MQEASLHGPPAESIDLSTFTDGYCQVLMPRHFPIRALSFVKQDSLNCEAPCPKDGADNCANGLRHCKVMDGWDGQEISLCVVGVYKLVLKTLYCRFVETTGNNCKAILLYVPD